MINSKEEVLSWFRQQGAPIRIETLCALLECCLPFELRFAGTVLENLAKRDFHDLRDVEQRANKFMTSGSTPEDNRALLIQSLITDVPSVPSNGGIGHPNVPNPNLQHPARNSPATIADKNNRLNSSINSKLRQQSIPNINHDPHGSSTTNRALRNAGDSKTAAWVNDGHSSTGNPAKPTTNPNFMPINGINPKLIENHLTMEQTSSHNSGDSEDEVESVESGGDQSVLLNVYIRRRMILYLSLLQTANRDGANTFYELMDPSEINQAGGFDRLPHETLAELALLYTIGFYHPAFTFNQHYVLSEILMQIKLSIFRKQLGMGAYGGVFYAQGYDQKTGQVYVYQIPPQALTPAHLNQLHAQQMQVIQHHHSQPMAPVSAPTPQQPVMGVNSAAQSFVQNNVGITSNSTQGKPPIVDTTRGSDQPTLPYVYPANFPVFMGQSPPANNPVVHSTGAYYMNPQMATYTHPPTPLQSIPTVQPLINSAIVADKWNMRGRDKGSPSPSTNGNDTLDEFQININRRPNMSCFNCGSQSHYGHECKESSMDDMTRHLYRLNFNSKTESS